MPNICKKGFRKVKGNCKKIVRRIFKRKKSYNPFKMWGSYVGAVGYTFFLILSTKIDIIALKILALPMVLMAKILLILTGCNGLGCIGYGFAVIFIISPIFGFLIGWGIHSLVRKLRK